MLLDVGGLASTSPVDRSCQSMFEPGMSKIPPRNIPSSNLYLFLAYTMLKGNLLSDLY